MNKLAFMEHCTQYQGWEQCGEVWEKGNGNMSVIEAYAMLIVLFIGVALFTSMICDIARGR